MGKDYRHGQKRKEKGYQHPSFKSKKSHGQNGHDESDPRMASEDKDES